MTSEQIYEEAKKMEIGDKKDFELDCPLDKYLATALSMKLSNGSGKNYSIYRTENVFHIHCYPEMK